MSQKELQRLYRTVKEFRRGILQKRPSSRMCYAVSAPLGGFLHFIGYSVELTVGTVNGNEHCWITFPDGIIVDPTADQFKQPNGESMPEVYIGEKPKWYVGE